MKNFVPDVVINIPGYCINRLDVCDGTRGLIVFSKSCIPMEVTFSTTLRELVKIDLTFNTGHFAIICLYRSPNSNDVNNDNIIHFFESLGGSDGHFIILGDFNLPRIDWPNLSTSPGASVFEGNFLDIVLTSGWSQLINQPTRFSSDQTPSLLDLVIDGSPRNISSVQVEPPMGSSDHCTFLIDLDSSFNFNIGPINTESHQLLKFTRPNYNYINIDLARSVCNFCDIYNTNIDFDYDYNYLLWCLSLITLHCVPKTHIFESRTPKFVFDNCVIPKSDVHDNLYANLKRSWYCYLKSRTPQLFVKFKKHLQDCKNFIHTKNQIHLNFVLSKINYNRNYLFKYVNRNTKPNVPISLCTSTDVISSDPLTVANCFASTFQTNFFNPSSVRLSPDPITIFLSDPIPFITAFDLDNIIKNLSNTSPGIDDISIVLIKKTFNLIRLPLLNILNSSLATGNLISDWKTSIIIPIHKANDRLHPNNYRPISIIPAVAKIIETAVLNQILLHLDHINFSWKFQHAFIKGKSTFTNLLITYSTIINSIDQGQAVDVIYLDCSAAFDSISHSVLLDRLKSIGLNTYIISWIANFLTDRSYCVKIGNAFSDFYPINKGIPQGSALGPILFNLYIQHILSTDLHSNSFIIAYADDIKIFRIISNHQDHRSLQHDLDVITNKLYSVNLKINLNKTCFIRFGQAPNISANYHIWGTAIPCVDSIRDLGVLVSTDLSWSTHTAAQVSKASKILAWYWKILPLKDPCLFSKVYKIYIQCFFDYSSSLVYPIFIKDRTLRDKPLRKFSKYLSNFSAFSFSDRLTHLNLWPLNLRIIYRDMVEVYKILNHHYFLDDFCILTLSHNTTTRGHKNKLYKNKFRLSSTGFFFTHRVTSFWNNLPTHIIDCNSLPTFRKSLYNYLCTYNGDMYAYS